MAAGDFFVNFDSNVADFATEARAELASVQGMVNALNESFARVKGIDLDKLVKGDGDQVKKLRKSLAKDLETRSGGGGTVAAGGGHVYTESLNRAVEVMASDLGRLSEQINKATNANLALLGSTQKLVQRVAGATGALPREGETTPRRRFRGPDGRLTSADTPGAIDDFSPEGRARAKGARPSAIQAVSKAQLDTASLDRVVNAVNRVETAVRETSRPTQDLASILSTIGPAVQAALAQSGGAIKVADEAIKSSKRGEKITDKELARRARIQQSLDFSTQDPEAMRGQVGRGKNKLGRAALVQIAEDLTSQGFPTGKISKKTTMEDLVRSISTAGQLYKQSGFATKEDLSTSGRVVKSAEISNEVRTMMGNLFNQVNSEALIAAREIIATDRRAGGTGPLRAVAGLAAPEGSYEAGTLVQRKQELQVQQRELQNQLGKAKTTSKRGAITDRIEAVKHELDDLEIKIKAASGEIQAGGSVQSLRQTAKGRRNYAIDPALVNSAEGVVTNFEDAVHARLMELAKSRSFQPFGPGVSQQITGDDELAQRARSVLAALRRGIVDLDNEARDFYKLSGHEQAASQRPNAALFRSEGFYGGYLARQIPEEAYLQSRLQSRRRYEAGQEVYQGINETLAGGSTMPGSRFDWTRRVPGLSVSKRGIEVNEEQINAEGKLTRLDPQVGRNIRNAARRYSTSLLLAARQYETEAEATEALERQIRDAEKLLNRIYSATGVAPSITQLIPESAAGMLDTVMVGSKKNPQSVAARDAQRQLEQEQRAKANAAKDAIPDSVPRASQARTLLKVQEDRIKASQALTRAQKREEEASKKLAAKEAEFEKSLSEADRAALLLANAEIDAARQSQAALIDERSRLRVQQDRIVTSEKASQLQQGAKRTSRGAYRNAALRDELGYDVYDPAGFPMGYGRSVQSGRRAGRIDELTQKMQASRQEVADAESRRASILGTAGQQEETALRKARAATEKAAKAEDELAKEVDRRRRDLTATYERRVEAARTNLADVQNKYGGEHNTIVPGSPGAELIPAAQERLKNAQTELARIVGLSTTDFAKEIAAAGGKAVGEIEQTKEKVKKSSGTRKEKEANDSEREAIIAQRRTLADQRKAIGDEKKALVQAGDEGLTRGQKGARTRKINALAAEYNEISKAIDGLDAQIRGGGGKGGGGGKRTGGGGTGAGAGAGGGRGSYNNILKQILDAINRVNTTLKAGVPTKGTTGGGKGTTTTTGGGKTTTTGVAGGSARLTEEQKRGVEERRAALRELAAKRETIRIQEESLRLAADEARVQEMSTRTTQQATEADIRAATAKLQLDTAMSRVSASTKRELEVLRQLTKEGNAERIATQQRRTNLAIRADLGQYASEADKTSTSRTLIESASGQMSAGGFRQLQDSTKAVEEAVARTGQAAFGDQSPMARFINGMFGTSGFWARVVHTTGTFVVRNFAAGFVFGLTNQLQEVVKQAIITEQTFVRVSNALEATGKPLGNLREGLQQISSDYGTSLNDVYDTAAGLVGLFQTPLQITSATRVVAQLQTISDGALNAQEAMGVLGSITSSYSDQLSSNVDGFKHVADVLTTIQNVIGTNVEVTAEGVASLSGLAKQLHLGFEQTSVIVAQIAKQTNQTGAAAGEQFGRILGSLQTGRGQSAITKAFTEASRSGKISPDQGQALMSSFQQADYGSVLNILMKNWDNLSESQQRNIAVTVAGQRQMRAFAAMMGNTAATLKDIDKATYESGSAQERMDKIMRQLNGQLKILSANFQNLASNLVRSGILTAVAVALRLVNTALGGINTVLTKLNDFTDSNGATKLLKNLTFGMLGLVVAMKALKAAREGLGGAILGRTLTGARAAEAGGTGGGGGALANAGWLAMLFGGRGRAGRGAADRVGLRERYQRRANALMDASLNYGMMRQTAQAGLYDRIGAESRTPFGRALQSRFPTGTGVAGYAVAEKSAAAASRSVGALGAVLGTVAEGGIAVQGPLAAAGVAMLAFADNISRTRKTAEENVKLLDEFNNRFGLTPTTADQKDSLKTGWDKFGDKGSATWRAYSDVLSEAGRNILHGNISNVITGGFLRSGIARDKGTEVGNLNQGYGVTAAQKLYDGGVKSLNAARGTSGAVLQAQNDFNKKLEKARDEILNDSSTSAAQKQTALKALEQAGIAIQDQASLLVLKAKGIGKADALTTDQIQSLQTAIQAIGQLGGRGGAGGVSFQPIYDLLKNDVGAQDGGEIKQLLDQMTTGNIDSATLGVDTRKLLSKSLDEVQSILSTVKPEDERYAVLQQLALQLGQQLIQSSTDLVKTLQTNAETASSVYSKLGQYRRAAGAYKPAIAQAQANLGRDKGAPKGIAAPNAFMFNSATTQGKEQALIDQNQLNELTRAAADMLLNSKLKKLRKELSTADPKMARIIQAEINRIIAAFEGKRPGIYSPEEINSAVQQNTTDNQAAADLQRSQREAAGQTALAKIGPNNAMGLARQQLANAKQAQADAYHLGTESVEYQSATQQVIQAQWAIVSAQGDIAQANASLRAAYANARGDTVGAARAGLAAANAALAYAKRLSGGARSAEVINAQAQVIQARAAVQDARLQDQQDTIDFNLQMGKITSAAAIQALEHILKVEKLNKQQRRALLLKIKGMKDELSSDGQWNFGSINLPTPYSVRRYLAQQKLNQQQALATAAGFDNRYDVGSFGRGGAGRFSTSNDNRSTTILVNGADTAKVLSLIRQVVGSGVRVRTVQPRRR